MILPRGAVVALAAPRIGFLREAGSGQPAVVIQPPFLTARLATVIVVPLLEPTPAEASYPLYVPVDAAESGLKSPAVAVCPLVRGVPVRSLLPGVLGQLSATTLGQVARLLRLLQGL